MKACFWNFNHLWGSIHHVLFSGCKCQPRVIEIVVENMVFLIDAQCG